MSPLALDPRIPLVLRAQVAVDVAQRRLRRLLRRSSRRLLGQCGEGVISAAIAVLIMAFLGALMWAAFKEVFAGATAKTRSQVDLIGS